VIDYKQKTIETLEQWECELDRQYDELSKQLQEIVAQRKQVKGDLKHWRAGVTKSKGSKPKQSAGKEVIMPMVHSILGNRGATDLPTLRGLVLDQLKESGAVTTSNGLLRAFTQWLHDDKKIQEVKPGEYGLSTIHQDV